MTTEQGPELERLYELLERVIAVEEQLAEVVDRLTPPIASADSAQAVRPVLRVVRQRKEVDESVQ